MKTLVRGGLLLLAVIETVLGLWTVLLPKSFYDVVPGVDALPFNEHLMRDFGAASLGLALVIWVAFFRSELWLARLAFGAYLLFAVPHLVYHQTHLEGLSTGDTLFTMISLWLAVLIPASLLALTREPQVAKSNVSPPSV
jgi:hypothetical protein